MAILEPTKQADTFKMMQRIRSIRPEQASVGTPVGLGEGTERELIGTLEQMRKIRDERK